MSDPVLRFVVVGDPIEHSRSPRIQQAALDWNGISGWYGKRQVDEAGMRAVVDELRAGALHGVNVTMPHKLLAAELADDLSPDAARCFSVNTLSLVDGRVRGDSTDVAGVRWAWETTGWTDEPAYVLGAGGAAAAALVALEGRPLAIAARRREQAESLVARVGVDATVVPWGSAVAAVVVNATPIGMQRGAELPGPVLEAAAGLFDMVYGRHTEAQQVAAAREIPYCDGGPMLVGQAAASFSIWTGVVAPRAVMLRALRADS